MSVNPVKRKLAAILAADAVGYSRMMAADEEGTMKILQAHRSMIDGIIEFHEGRIINTAGDSVLAEFASPTQAVRCAVEIQDALKTRNDTLPEERRMHFRIGVNLGDVMVKGDDLLGDGVNVAARLEGIAEPGMIYIASSVYDQIAGKLDLGFVDLGDQSLKNIDRPIRTYRVDRDSRRVTTGKRRSGSSPMPWIAAGVAVVAIGAGFAWYQGQQSAARQDEVARAKSATDAELAKARAEADEAKKSAASASAAAEAAKRALEEQRIAESRAKAQAEVAAARAEADATRRKAEAELASATKARRAAEEEVAKRKAEADAALAAAKAAAKPAAVAVPPAPVATPAKWAATFACGVTGPVGPGWGSAKAASVGNAFHLVRGKPGEPASLQMKGTRQPDGRLVLSGEGIASLAHVKGQSFAASVDGRFVGERYEGRGKFGDRDCVIVLVTEAAAAKEAAELAARYPGPWTAHVACASFSTLPPALYRMGASAAGQRYEIIGGKQGEPGTIRMSGERKTDGRMRVAGKGMASNKEFYGQTYEVAFDGRFASERFEGRGKFGTRDCTLFITRR
jgi:class 3 adenylate cyclase